MGSLVKYTAVTSLILNAIKNKYFQIMVIQVNMNILVVEWSEKPKNEEIMKLMVF